VTEAWQLSKAVNLRPEVFGGMAFHRRRGITLEVDGEAYRLLCGYIESCSLPSPGHPAAHLVPQLARMGFLRPATLAHVEDGFLYDLVPPAQLECESLHAGVLSAPETVHVAITARCNLNCPGCYVPRQPAGPELSVAEWCGLIDQWAHMRVFQLAVGGGEPLLYEGLFDVLAYASRRGIVPSLTTNGVLLDADRIEHLQRASVARVNVSWNWPGGEQPGRSQAVMRAIELLLASDMHAGVNVLITPELLPRLSHELARLHSLGVRRVTILRPKPPADASQAGMAWYETNRLRRDDLVCLREVLQTWQGVLDLEIDSALVGLMGDAGAAILRWRGVYGCSAGRRICTVWPDGRVTPCSFLTDWVAGNVRQASFAELWERGAQWESLRDASWAAQARGSCEGCAAMPQCGGARCIARHDGGGLLAGDVECPWTAVD
jgi:radical SAM protein with 4Fe4S-binding SPASM domain